jgi:hypothetical protein
MVRPYGGPFRGIVSKKSTNVLLRYDQSGKDKGKDYEDGIFFRGSGSVQQYNRQNQYMFALD